MQQHSTVIEIDCFVNCGNMQSNAHKSLLALRIDRNLLHRHFLPMNVGVGARRISLGKEIKLKKLTKRMVCVAPCQTFSVYNNIILRHSSNWSFAKLYANWFGDKKLDDKLGVDKNERRNQREDEQTIHTGNLICSCESSKDLLGIIVPCINDDTLTLGNGILAIERLQHLVYQEILETYPDLPYGSVKAIYKNLSLMKETEKAFEKLRDNPSFEALKEFLYMEIDDMDEKQSVLCFACLVYLNVSKSDLTLNPFFLRLNDCGYKGFDLSDILKLTDIADCLPSPMFLPKYVTPKLCHFLREHENHALDVSYFQALLALINAGLKYINHQELLIIYNLLYKTCNETDCLDDLGSATELLSHLGRTFFTRYPTKENKSLFYELNSENQGCIIQKMSDMCYERIVARTMDLEPNHLGMLSQLLRSVHRKSTLHDLAVNRSLSLLNNDLQCLSLPELIWILSGFVRKDVAALNSETKRIIRNRFNSLDTANLCQIYAITGKEVLEDLKLFDVIWTKTIACIDEIFENEEAYTSFLKFCQRVRTEELSPKRVKLDNVLQRKLIDTYRKSYFGLLRRFHVDLLFHLIGIQSLIPSTLNILLPIAEDRLVYENMSNSQLRGMIHCVLKNNSHIERSQCQSSSFSDEEKSISEQVRFCVLTKSIAAYCRNVSAEEVDPILLLQILSLLDGHRMMDPLLVRKILDCLQGSDFSGTGGIHWLMKCSSLHQFTAENNEFRNQATSAVVSDILHHDEKYHDLILLVTRLNFLLDYNYEVESGSKFEKILMKLLKKDMELHRYDSAFLVLFRCSLLNVDVSEEIASVFSVPTLSMIDKLVQEGVLNKQDMHYLLFLLNQEACIRYPELGIPWIHATGDARKFSNIGNSKRYSPGDLSYAIEELAGGNAFVGKDVILDFGIPAWRAILVDVHNTPVEFTRDNVSQAEELQYKKIVFRYFSEGCRNPSWQQKRHLEYFSKMGWKVIEIYSSEWNSISLTSPEDRETFLAEKILQDTSSTEIKCLHSVNRENVSEQWRRALDVSDEQYYMRHLDSNVTRTENASAPEAEECDGNVNEINITGHT